MSTKPLEKSQSSGVDSGRRNFLKKSGAALAAGIALSPLSALTAPGIEQEPDIAAASDIKHFSSGPSHRPNIVFLITDQERFPQHWPEGWADDNLPNRKRLADHGLTFTRAFCNSAMCSPSRATLFTGLYPAQHGVTETLQTGGTDDDGTPSHVSQTTLQPTTQNIAKMLASAGYNVQYRGKWHISKDATGTLDAQSPLDLGRHGFQGWRPPDGGTNQDAVHFGGGDTNYDAQYAAQAADFLKNADPKSSRPFALFVCLINPHDLMAYPSVWDQPSYSDIPPFEGSDNYGKDAPICFELGIDLPPTIDEPPLGNFKPSAQARSTLMWDSGLGALSTYQQKLNYVNFYAFLHKESDQHMGTVLDALEASVLSDKTIVIRLADHGEMGLAHGGMRQKAYNAYEETIHVPLVISNPRLFPGPVQTQALASLIDIMPTVATLAGVPNRERWKFMGRDLTPIIQDAIDHPTNPTATIQDFIYFTTDETLGLEIVGQPSRVRCLREAAWKVTEYFDPTGVTPSQFELYDLVKDPLELHNMADPANVAYYNPAKLSEMLAKLHRRMDETGNSPFHLSGDRSNRFMKVPPRVRSSAPVGG
jgi:choline-sulfatase